MYSKAYAFCETVSQQLGIDETHNQTHMARVAQLTSQLNQLCDDLVSTEEETVMLLASMTHDLCDHKYVEVETGLHQIHEWLIQLPITSEMVDAVLQIITTMSYSKVRMVGYPTNLGLWERAYHHVRIADLIDAYDISRSYQFQGHQYPDMDSVHKWQRVIKIFEERVIPQMDTYIIPVCPYALSLVKPIHDRVVTDVSLLKMNYL